VQDGSAAKITPKLVLRHLFFFALTWSVGASCNLDGRKKFNEFLSGMMNLNEDADFRPKSGSVYNSCLLSTFHNWEWMQWIETIPPNWKLDPKTPFGSILVIFSIPEFLASFSAFIVFVLP